MNKKKTSRTEKLVLEGQVVCVSVCVYMYIYIYIDFIFY